MPNTTDNYGLERIRNGDYLSYKDWKYTDRDRQLIDRLLFRGAESHLHDGLGAVPADPGSPLSYNVTSAGTLPAGSTIRYKYTYVDDEGFETAASPETTITTPSGVSNPNAPTLAASQVGGTLLAGSHWYMISAYKTVNTQETLPSTRVYERIASGVSTGLVLLTFPSLPGGATGWNIYKREPNQNQFYYLTSVNMNVATPPTSYTDDGSDTVDCNRIPAARNTTANNSAIELAIPGATPTVPAGAIGWKLYRAGDDGNWDYSFLAFINDEVSPGVINTGYTDTGIATQAGRYPDVSEIPASPSKIDLTSEVSGILPQVNVAPRYVVNFSFPDTLSVGEGAWSWLSPYSGMRIVEVTIHLGPDSYPSSNNVVVDILKYSPSDATPQWQSIFTSSAAMPKVLVGNMIGSPVIVFNGLEELEKGDLIRADVYQAGGGATPTDRNLVVTVYVEAWENNTAEPVFPV